MAKYINPFTDFGFKFIFGREDSKPFLMDFLNELLRDEPEFEPITDIEYLNKEKGRSRRDERGIIYDILCRSSSGKHFIVEMQNSAQAYFIDRSIYYASRAIVDQGVPGKSWEYEYMPVYFVAFMNFKINELGNRVRTDAAICDLNSKKPLSDKMRFVFIELPNFTKIKDECETVFDKWIYILKNMEIMDRMPFIQERKLFNRLATVTSYASLTEAERREYDADLKAYRDLTNQISYAEKKGVEEGFEKGMEKGIEKGMEKGMMQIVLSMYKNGTDIETISRLTDLPLEKVRQILE